jgi:ATP-dependent helicase IRC3
MNAMNLRPYQIESIQAIYAAYERGLRRLLLVLPTGTGKTVTFAALIQSWQGRALVLAHRDRLIQQGFEKIRTVLPLERLGIVKADQNRHYADCVLASVQTLSRAKRLAPLRNFKLLIIDEAHRSAAKSYRQIIDHVCEPDTLLLGVTATPDRSDGVGLETIYQDIVYEMKLLDAIDQGYLSDLRAIQIKIPCDFSALHTKTNQDGVNDYKLDEVATLMDASNWVENVTRGWRENAADRRTIAFVPRVKQAYALADYMKGLGISAAALDGSTDLGVQRAMVDSFERGRIQVLVNCDLFVEGADIPSINCVMMCRPTKSRTIYSQAIGRGTRLSPATGKTDCLVLDMVGISNRLDLCTAATLIGAKEIQRGESLREAKKREEEAAEQLALAMDQYKYEGDLEAREVDLFGGQKELRKHGKLEWSVDRVSRQSVLHVKDHRFEIWRPTEDGPYQFADMSRFNGIQGTAPTYRDAERRCEEAAEELMFGGPEAAWRAKPASEKQIALMTKLKIRFKPDITSGEAAALIDKRFGRKKAA